MPKKTSTEPVPPLPGLRERKKARTKATIQREALRLFSEHGYAETSVEQIAAAAEVSPSTFFRYFPTKEEVVLAEFIDSRLVELFRTAPAELDPIPALRHAVNAMADVIEEDDLELESLRNLLIQQVPELRRGLFVELLRPMQMIGEVIVERLGPRVEEEDARTFAGALVGGMVAATLPADGAAQPPVSSAEFRTFVMARLDRIEPMLTLPRQDTASS